MCAIPQLVSALLNPRDFRAYLVPSSLKLKIFLAATHLYSLLVQKHLYAEIIIGLLLSLDINNKIANTKAT